MAELDQLTVATKRYIRKTPALVDNVFNRDPFLAYAKLNVREDFTGGRLIGEDFVYDALIGGFYQKGKEFDVTEKQVEQQAQFLMKFAEAGVTLSKEDVQVLNKGPEASFRLIESRLTNAYMTIGAHMAIALYLNGVRAGFTPFYNGIAEALNDNSTVSWDNNTYSTYGGITRGGAVGNALNSAPTNVNGTIEYNTLEETYGDASFGDAEFEPNLGVTTVKRYSYIKEKFQTQQRFNDTQDPRIGFNGLKFNNATLIKSRYVPGSDIVTANTDSNKIAVAMLKETSGNVITAYPPLAVSASETLLWLNCRKPFFFFYLSNDPEFGLGFTGFKPGQGNTKIVGQVLAASAITFPGPRYHRQIHGFTG